MLLSEALSGDVTAFYSDTSDHTGRNTGLVVEGMGMG